MKKIFEFQGYKGSYIDPISGTVGNNFNGEFKRTTKGLAWKSDGVSEINTNVNPSLSTFTLECWLNANDVTSLQNVGSNKKLGDAEDGYDFIISSGNILFGVANGLTINQSYKDISAYQNKYIHIIATYDGSINKIYINNVEGVEASANGSPNGVRNIRIAYDDNSGRFLQEAFIGKYVIYDGVISATERASLYKQFLKASPVTYGNAGTKPSNYITNLENEYGLVVAYNFNKDTVKTDKVLDISGNQNDGTINGNPLLTKNSLKFDGVNDYLSTSSEINLGTQQTILFRGSLRTINLCGVCGNGVVYYRIDTANIASFFGGSRIDIPHSLNADTIYDFAIVRDGLLVKFYADGELIGQGSETINGDFKFDQIGSIGTGALQTWKGSMINFRTFNIPLSEQEVKDYHNSFIQTVIKESFEDNAVSETNPIGWLKGSGSYDVNEFISDSYNFKDNTSSDKSSEYSTVDGNLIFNGSNYVMTATNTTVHLGLPVNIKKDNTYRYKIVVKSDFLSSFYITTRNGTAKGTVIDSVDLSANVGSSYTTLEGTFSASADAEYFALYDTAQLSVGETYEFTTFELENISLLENGTKYLECTSSGTSAFASNTVYGEWEFSFKKTESSESEIYIINTQSEALGDGYVFRPNTQERVGFYRVDDGVLSYLFFTPIDYISHDTWYGIKITRTTDGEFTVYIKGGEFGDDYVIVDTTGGSGANPITDNTHTESKFFVTDLDDGNSIANIGIKDGVKK